jgi:hypothetical protein
MTYQGPQSNNHANSHLYDLSPETSLPMFLDEVLSQEVSNVQDDTTKEIDNILMNSHQFKIRVDSEWPEIREALILFIGYSLFVKKMTDCTVEKHSLSISLHATRRILVAGTKIKSGAPNPSNAANLP